jgi:glycosyltransferase involved in cell wall biosynthesis
MTNPLFSIIVPTFNRAGHLGRCLESLKQQTLGTFEVIIVDDGSTDSTRDVVKLYEKCLNLTYQYQTNWGGPAKPRNKGISVSRGDWVCFLDSDDWWYPNKLETISAYLSKGDILYHNLDIYTTKGKKLFRKSIGRRVSSSVFIDLIVNGNAISNSSAVVRKALLEQVGGLCEDKNLIAVEDSDLWLMLGKISDRFCYIPRSLGGYWANEESITEISSRQITRIEALYKKHLPDILPEHLVEADAYKKYCLGGIYYKMGLLDKALPLLIEARYVHSPVLKFKSYAYRLLIFAKSIQKR